MTQATQTKRKWPTPKDLERTVLDYRFALLGARMDRHEEFERLKALEVPEHKKERFRELFEDYELAFQRFDSDYELLAASLVRFLVLLEDIEEEQAH